MVNSSITDETLWQRLKSGDEWAFSALFERYYRSLISYGNSLSAYPERVQDCVQDVFVNVWLYRNSLSENVVVKAYLLSSVRKRIARLHERDTVFRQTASLESVQFSLDFSIEDQLIADEETAARVSQLNRLINTLPARQKEALYLRYHQGLSIEQIGEMLDINHQSVSNLLHRCIQHLRKEWKGDLTLLLLLFSRIL
ncbi:RNA polymerase sigma factor [Runella slithyformis]|uniref:RNA polymerase, sigma-24 subunit, ECF subfamily n=1 Tax=Runella slithyformis (strain ATCC 29530 / DSM 19594 / LMG 11500 / NCIMB 11436 / LSU 4) TaxID=761193 RepID=A0A7U4E8E0_RUNSL|nr:sigma-70 family RNA polymerase sigma factor [Runella slithyformis]AEI51238.1 RNA polymerase, sigma-24 subunit, ECF subfamily [Runella slithyformis DSM 19594]